MRRGINKINWLKVVQLYCDGASIPDLVKQTGATLSTIRYRLKNVGVLRSREQALRLAAKQGKLGKGKRRKGFKLTEEHKNKIRKAKLGKGKGYRKTKNGYYEITMGNNKGKMVHRVVMEEHLGRTLKLHECVHHIDRNTTNNNIENLQVMTRADHTRLHALEDNVNRNRDKLGRYT